MFSPPPVILPTANTGFTVTLPYNAVGNITGGGENIYVSPMIRGIL